MAKAKTTRRQLTEYRRKRDFGKTAEPAGGNPADPPTHALRFVIQKHAASHLHFDFRLELDGVMKSWAVPKGPSIDPSVKRLAMEVEDHPIEYNTFEGTIPKGQYGGGTVMLWDRGTYSAHDPGSDPAAALRLGYEKGDMKFVLSGERLHGSWVLVQTKRPTAGKPQWLLIKHRDEFADAGSDIVADVTTSVNSGRTMDEIAAGKGRVWQSNRAGTVAPSRGTKRPVTRKRASQGSKADVGPEAALLDLTVASSKRVRTPAPAKAPSKRAVSASMLEPMYASVGTGIPEGGGWTFEPKYDGIRVLAFATAKSAKLMTRNGKDKSKQFPEVVDALVALAAKARRPLVLDGEIVALIDGVPARFQELQARMHVKEAEAISGHRASTPAALLVFDQLLDGDDVLLAESWSARRARLEKTLRNRTSPPLRLGESIPGDGAEMLDRARADGWEGVIAKRMDSPYEPGNRSKTWLKLKIEFRQEFVIGGYTEPRNTREHIGALLLGYFDRDRFIYVGHTGGGFTRAGLQAMARRLKPLSRKTSPFEETPKTNELAHWVRPEIVVEVKFNEWTADGKLRQPIYLGTRDDKEAREVGLEPPSVQKMAESTGITKSAPGRRRRVVRDADGTKKAPRAKRTAAATKRATASKPAAKRTAAKRGGPSIDVVARLDVIEQDGGNGTLTFGRGQTLDVSSLGKVFFPGDGYTKGDLMRYYARMAPYILPVIEDRPLVLKRFPNGIKGMSFYQQKASPDTPEGVRVQRITNDEGEEQDRFIGGDLLTLLYTIQLGSISVDPWHARVQTCDDADYSILDLDPGPRAPFRRVVDVARWVKEELDALGLHGALKTSGSTGLHIYVPLPSKTPDEAALMVAQIIAGRVATVHPREATVERSVKARGPAAVYVDYLQNIRGKTVAGAYAVRAKKGATVSTPLTWDELVPTLDPREFTIETVPTRVAEVGDLWAREMSRKNPTKALRAIGNLSNLGDA